MWMPADELFGDRFDHTAEIERTLFLGHAGVEDDLEEEIAELVLEVGKVFARNGVGDLVGFLDGVRRDGRKILRQVPRAAAPRGTQRCHDLDEPADVARRGHGRFPFAAGSYQTP